MMTHAPTEAVAATLLAQLEQAWNAADGAAFGAAFATECDFVDIRGTHHRGRAAVAAGHQGIFDTIYAGSTVRYELDRARLLGPGSIVAVASATMTAPTGPLRGVNHARLTVTLVRQADGWAVGSFHNTLVAGEH